MFDSLQPHELQHARPPCPSPTPGFSLNDAKEIEIQEWPDKRIQNSYYKEFSGSYQRTQINNYWSQGNNIGTKQEVQQRDRKHEQKSKREILELESTVTTLKKLIKASQTDLTK